MKLSQEALPPEPESSVSEKAGGRENAGAGVPGAEVHGAEVPGAEVPGAEVPVSKAGAGAGTGTRATRRAGGRCGWKVGRCMTSKGQRAQPKP